MVYVSSIAKIYRYIHSLAALASLLEERKGLPVPVTTAAAIVAVIVTDRDHCRTMSPQAVQSLCQQQSPISRQERPF